jgi:uracil-DNA glycosylase
VKAIKYLYYLNTIVVWVKIMSKLRSLLRDVRACELCKEKFISDRQLIGSEAEQAVRPVLQANENAKILIAGQAPGRKVHISGIPFDDASGDRLRQWLGLSKAQFYDEQLVAILPMAFCFPGTGKSGDLAPPPRCAKQWRSQLLELLPNLQLTVLLGQYALKYHLPGPTLSVTEQVKAWRTNWPTTIALPHPSPRNNIWLSKNAWFSEDVLPPLKSRVQSLLENSIDQ